MGYKWTDGVHDTLRPVQLDALEFAWSSESVVVGLNLPPGSGKSSIARALQKRAGSAAILTSDNTLVDQYGSVLGINTVKGRTQYDDYEDYTKAFDRAKAGVHSVYNPLSFFYARQRGVPAPDMLIVDEAHLLIDMLMYMSAYIIPIAKTNAPQDAKCEADLIKWCSTRYHRLLAAITKSDDAPPPQVYREFETLSRLYHSLKDGTQLQVFDIKNDMVPYSSGRPQKCLVLTPVRVPDSLIKEVTGATKVVLLSGTLSQYDTELLSAGRGFAYKQYDYLAPAASRPVYFTPVPQELRRDTDIIADRIRAIRNQVEGPILVHCTYAQQRELAEYLSDLRPLRNDKHNKLATIERFKQHGGVWLAAGCSEGVDLPGDFCPTIIIPTLLFPDKGDIFVQKRLGLPGGEYWYKLRTVQNTIQRIGRGLRSATDSVTVYILDPAFARIYPEVAHEYAKLNVIWGTYAS